MTPQEQTGGGGHSSARPTPRRRRDAAATRRRILDAARARFTPTSFDAVPLSAIARDAGVDKALVARYFGSKQQLFTEAMQPSFDVGAALADESPERVVRHLLERLENDGPRLLALPFAGEPGAEATAQLRDRLDSRLTQPIAQRLIAGGTDPDDAPLHAELAIATVVGTAFMRSVLRTPALAGTPSDDIAAVLTPRIRKMVGEGQRPTRSRSAK
jgi:AcrR family transcriptional regulator